MIDFHVNDIFPFQQQPLKSLASQLEVTTSPIQSVTAIPDTRTEYEADTYTTGTQSQNTKTKPIVCGHRGALYNSLENTVHSIQTAQQMGCDEVEIDVFVLKCGTLCVFHGSGTDENPGLFDEYCTGVSSRSSSSCSSGGDSSSCSGSTSNDTSETYLQGSILDYTYEELQDYYSRDINLYNEEFGCGPSIIQSLQQSQQCYIPTLEEVLRSVQRENDKNNNDMKVKIELKGPNTALPTLLLVEELNMVSQVHYSSFELSRIRQIRELRPQRHPITREHIYKTGALFAGVPPPNFIDIATSVGASEVHLQYSECTKSRVNSIHGAGMDSMCWFRGPVGMKEDVTEKFFDVGNEDVSMFQVVLATGVRKLCTNRPDVLLGLLMTVDADDNSLNTQHGSGRITGDNDGNHFSKVIQQ